jgi:hypothetical protein
MKNEKRRIYGEKVILKTLFRKTGDKTGGFGGFSAGFTQIEAFEGVRQYY